MGERVIVQKKKKDILFASAERMGRHQDGGREICLWIRGGNSGRAGEMLEKYGMGKRREILGANNNSPIPFFFFFVCLYGFRVNWGELFNDFLYTGIDFILWEEINIVWGHLVAIYTPFKTSGLKYVEIALAQLII